ncbi:hypothetical protein [Frigidibacter sp. MR17.24]|uniref:hypothetical protein n=1 Tax=Frigidibacter sp. MR17.24 TaxID=3127345 RepID=UPI003012C216
MKDRHDTAPSIAELIEGGDWDQRLAAARLQRQAAIAARGQLQQAAPPAPVPAPERPAPGPRLGPVPGWPQAAPAAPPTPAPSPPMFRTKRATLSLTATYRDGRLFGIAPPGVALGPAQRMVEATIEPAPPARPLAPLDTPCDIPSVTPSGQAAEGLPPRPYARLTLPERGARPVPLRIAPRPQAEAREDAAPGRRPGAAPAAPAYGFSRRHASPRPDGMAEAGAGWIGRPPGRTATVLAEATPPLTPAAAPTGGAVVTRGSRPGLTLIEDAPAAVGDAVRDTVPAPRAAPPEPLLLSGALDHAPVVAAPGAEVKPGAQPATARRRRDTAAVVAIGIAAMIGAAVGSFAAVNLIMSATSEIQQGSAPAPAGLAVPPGGMIAEAGPEADSADTIDAEAGAEALALAPAADGEEAFGQQEVVAQVFPRAGTPPRDDAGFRLGESSDALGFAPRVAGRAEVLPADLTLAELAALGSARKIALLQPVEGAASQLALPAVALAGPPTRPDPEKVRQRRIARAEAARAAAQRHRTQDLTLGEVVRAALRVLSQPAR